MLGEQFLMCLTKPTALNLNSPVDQEKCNGSHGTGIYATNVQLITGQRSWASEEVRQGLGLQMDEALKKDIIKIELRVEKQMVTNGEVVGFRTAERGTDERKR